MKRNLIKSFLVVAAFSTILVACKKDAVVESESAVTTDVLEKIHELGFSNKNVIQDDGGYIVEGDIFLSARDLDSKPASTFMRIGGEEQYRTTNLVKSTPRVITVSISSQLPVSYVAALDECLSRYNALNLTITFQRVSSGANISIVRGNGSYLASAGFPTSAGEPYNQVKVNSRAIGNQPQSTVATILAHEIGHCIGFRHTDYMDRSYSCGGATSNEGASTVGAILIPGTPAGPDPNSWMLACIGSGQDRPFNANDRTALTYLY